MKDSLFFVYFTCEVMPQFIFHKETEIPFPISRISEKANVIWERKKRRNTKVAAELSNESDCSFPHLHLCIIYSKLVSPQHLIAQKIHPFSWGHYSRSMDSRQADVTLNKMPPSAAPSFTMQSFDIKQTHEGRKLCRIQPIIIMEKLFLYFSDITDLVELIGRIFYSKVGFFIFIKVSEMHLLYV